MQPEFESIYNSESYARRLAESRGIDTENLCHDAIIDAIEEWEEENC